ncbi:hypothetical protein [Shouchella tritolerans]|uniref:hypothetical protein n=1 Tax=Shouchella tritolerans TaxID=2979466 RepID=UPI0021E97532|nr:hypothetical protein [Shouchella tritolerans]
MAKKYQLIAQNIIIIMFACVVVVAVAPVIAVESVSESHRSGIVFEPLLFQRKQITPEFGWNHSGVALLV